ncbi:MAG: hypothetical protein RLZ75_1272 [Pseudomonadota bacterium]|jgi:hypothetical protein
MTDLLEELIQTATDNLDLGDKFEPLYASELLHV